ncbi:A-kinase anchor protein 9 isoform X3 [Toxorhynchites rutilus septentrionalis]|uniref:A-kinase anchor protein 9 isoform X3 n=1 Tax=Toxorhynchites rutilus septentrionalis TaxID=329112 RepID=UPI002478A1E6|nr:A-kinase anchor protein 9 isoform X3 [Toxorhynchites rutilus septentrionalis]
MMNIGRLKLKPRGSSGSKTNSSRSITEGSTSSPRFAVSQKSDVGKSSTTDNGGAIVQPSRSEQSVRFNLEDEIIGSLSASSASEASSGTNHEDSLEIMEEIEAQDDGSKHDGNLSSSISEKISMNLEKTGQASGVQKTADARKRTLFDFEDKQDELFLGGVANRSNFDIDDLQLSGDEIAQHFQSHGSDDDPKDDIFSVKFSRRRKLLQQNHDVDSLEQILNDIGSSEGEDEVKQEVKSSVSEEKKSSASIASEKQSANRLKELSPLNEDDVLINNNKVNLHSLKKPHKQSNVQDNSGDNSLNTTNDISELARDTESERIMSDNYDRSSRSESSSNKQDDNYEKRSPRSTLQPLSRSKSVEAEQCSKENVKPTFASLGDVEMSDAAASSDQHNRSVEEDNSIEELIMSNHSIEISVGALGAGIVAEDITESNINQLSRAEHPEEESSSDSNSSGDLKEKVMTSSKSFEEAKSQHELEIMCDKLEDNETVGSKQMEKVTEFKEPLEDISEESEQTLHNSNHSHERTDTEGERSKSFIVIEKGKEIRKILEEKVLQKQLSISSTIYEDNKENISDSLPPNKSLDLDSVVSLNLFKAMENEIKKLHETIAVKDVMLESLSRRDSLKEVRADSLKDPQRSSDSNSIATNSTEYRPLNEQSASTKDLHDRIAEQNGWIEILADKLRETIDDRDRLHKEGLNLGAEIEQLKKQVAENVEVIKHKPHWMRDQESTGQRISEISIDLVSETDEALSDFPDMYEARSNRNSRERQLDINLEVDYSEQNPLHIPITMSNQVEQFRKYLSPDELRLFNMVQRKFDDFLKQELDNLSEKHEDEVKILQERLELQKTERESEVSRLRQMLANVKSGSTEVVELRNEMEARHTQEMDDLRQFFEKKCAELEKQYSEEVFSQQSRRLSNDTATDISDQEDFPEENGGYQSKPCSPKRKLKDEIYQSPTHRKITPTTVDTTDGSADEVLAVESALAKEPDTSMEGLRSFYQNKIKDSNRKHEVEINRLRERLKQYEDNDTNEEFISNNETTLTSQSASHLITQVVASQSAVQPDSTASQPGVVLLTEKSTDTITTTTNITTVDIGTEPSDDLHEIIADYERRLKEQVALARQDVLRELEVQIQTLLSDSATEDSDWPAEFVLLREKFTAKSQLEIAQLQIKHEEEMARIKADFEKQLQWKLKRQTTFDSARDFDKIISERDNLRELSSTLRNILGELVKYVSNCEEDLNNTFIGELQKHGIVSCAGEETLETSLLDMNASTVLTLSPKKIVKFAPDVSGLMTAIEDPSLLEFISKENIGGNQSANLDDCLERLRLEATQILKLSEKLAKQTLSKDEDLDKVSVKSDSCEEEDGLKRAFNRKEVTNTRSLDDNMVRESSGPTENQQVKACSLPTDLGAIQSSSELNIQLHELRNRLLKSEDEKRCLKSELDEVLSKHSSLVVELSETKQHLLELNTQRVEFSEGYGTNVLMPCVQWSSNSFFELQERAKHILGSANLDSSIDQSANLLQLVEDFCREGERYMEDEKRDKTDLQSQKVTDNSNDSVSKIEAADKQLKATRQFLEEQAAERELERDEFVKEIQRLKSQLREKDKDKVNFERVTKEEGLLCGSCSCDIDNREIIEKLESVEQQSKEFSTQLTEKDDKIRKLEIDLKDSIDKGFTLREIITELETQIESKTINEHVLDVKIKELENYIDAQNRQNESLHHEVESIRTDIAVRGYEDKIAKLEEELQRTRPSVEHSLVLEALTAQLRDIEETLDKKARNLETLHSNSAASLVCSSPSEDVSVNHESPLHKKKINENGNAGQPLPPLPVDEVQRIFDKLHRHTRIEEVAIKRINDLEMQIGGLRGSFAELQHERDVLQERMSEQSLKITTLQSKLDEQRLRAEELHRQGTSHLTVKVHDLQNELVNLKETLQTRDKQIASLKNFLENSQQVIERQEKELAINQANNDRSQYELKLEADLRAKCDEIQQLKSKIQNEMINKVALPDLMETMLADKNDEIDQLKEKLNELQTQQHKSQPILLSHGKEDDNARTLSDIVSITDCDESDMVMRRMPEQGERFLPANSIPMETSSTMFHSKEAPQTSAGIHHPSANASGSPHLPKPSLFPPSFEAPFFQNFSAAFARPTSSAGASSGGGTPEFLPRQINFSVVDDSRSTESRSYVREPAFIEEIQDEVEEVVPVKRGGESGVARLSDISENAIEEDRGKLENELESLKLALDRVTNEKNESLKRLQADIQNKIDLISDIQVELAARNKLYEDLLQEKKDIREELENVKVSLRELECEAEKFKKKEVELQEAVGQIAQKEEEIAEVKLLYAKLCDQVQQQTKENELLKSEQQKNVLLLDTLKQQVESLNKTIGHKDELLTKLEKDILNYSKNEEKYLEQLKSLDAKETELKIMQGNYKDRLHEIQILNEDNRFLNEDINRLKNEIARSSSSNPTSNPSYVQFLKQNCEKFEEELRETKVMLTEKMLSLERVKIDLASCQNEAELLKNQLKEKEMVIAQIGDDGNSLHEALSNIQNKMQENNNNLNKKLREEQLRNEALQAEVDSLKTQIQRSDNSSSPKPFSVEEIAEQLEKELNYSAQLDSSIMKAIESDDLNSEDENENPETKAVGEDQNDGKKLEELTQLLHMELQKSAKLLEEEKQNSNAIQLQDADIIEAMRLSLEAAIENESKLQNLLAEEKRKNERLSTLMAGVQRTKSFDNYLLMNRVNSPQESPTRRLNRSNEFESEMVARFESEIKFLTAQNDRERERTTDLQRVLERERNRFEKEIADRNEHGEQVKKELMRITKEKDRLEVEFDHEQEKLILAHKEIESLEKRISALQEAESMRSIRRERLSGYNSLESQELQSRLELVERERKQLQDTVQNLKAELERRKHREAKLTEALSRENSLFESGQGSVPEEFLTKLKDLNRMLEANARENHHQAETLRNMMEERKALQLRIQELERHSIHGTVHRYNRDDLEERANHLFGKYLRSESHRKALVHQKRYLQIVLSSYEENESKALQLLSAQTSSPHLQGLPLACIKQERADDLRKKRRSFRAVVNAVIAIERMKFIVRKWQGGQRACAKAIFSQQFTPRRTQSASTNVWTRSPNSHFVEYNASPSSRDRTAFHHHHHQQQQHQQQPVQSYSGHFMGLPEAQELRDKFDQQYSRLVGNR